MSNLPLDGIRVVDFGQTFLAPRLCEWLAVMGAEVIKIESKARLDTSRLANPYLSGEFDPKRAANFNIGTTFAVLNYSKKSCTLNMKQPRAVELTRKIISLSDVVVDNFSPGVMDRMGLGYPALRDIKPDIIMLSASATGSKGPLSDLPGYASVMDSWGGLSSITGYLGGWPDATGNGGWTDIIAAQYGAFAVLAALHHRSRTGEGQFIDLS
ncbi:MAG: CoA transferase, partial [Dehalococcoidales bacterium]|nr:CoA transferase [Dehalococcoidales bacterium]